MPDCEQVATVDHGQTKNAGETKNTASKIWNCEGEGVAAAVADCDPAKAEVELEAKIQTEGKAWPLTPSGPDDDVQ